MNTEGIFPRKAPPSLVRDLTARIPLPLPALIGIGILAIIIFFACGFFALNQLSTAVSNATRRTPTITRALPTVTLPLPPGASTPIPTFAATAPPFATFPGNPTPTRTTRAQRALDSSLPLNLDIDAIENIKVIVGINGVLVFNGAMDPGTSRSWSAKDSLYFRVENAKGAEIYFNGKRVLAAVFAEKTLMERQWTANSKATPVSVKPTPPKAPTPIPTATPTPTFNIETPTPTVTKTILN
ncbi:MAG: DUF4115 domain-containing protein [Chloroflexi bacterium]|nr:DUF4115 domain-containing protein [Chloroflexota bacterium]